MLTGKSAIPIDAAMHKRSAENVNTMVADLQRGGRTFKARARAVIIWSQSTLRINGKKIDPARRLMPAEQTFLFPPLPTKETF